MIDIKDMQSKLFAAIDANNEYTMEDFDREFKTKGLQIGDKHSDMFKFPVSYVNKSNNKDPEYATDGAAGFDLRANEELILEPGDYAMVSTGLFFELPPNLEIQVRPRSGLSAKYGVTVLNSPGTVDSDYRGEVKVMLINHGKSNFKIEVGDRIAQAVIATCTAKPMIKFNKVDKLNDNTERGTGGFGSTGVK